MVVLSRDFELNPIESIWQKKSQATIDPGSDSSLSSVLEKEPEVNHGQGYHSLAVTPSHR